MKSRVSEYFNMKGGIWSSVMCGNMKAVYGGMAVVYGYME